MSYIGASPIVGNFQVCDAISVVNGQAAYTMQVGSANVFPESANHMLVSLNGILQKPNGSFTISGSTITFSANLVTGDVIDFIQLLGDVLDIGTPSDATVTNAKTSFVSTSSAAGLQIKGDGTTDGTLQLNCSQNSHGIKLASPAHSSSQSYTIKFPTGNITADKFLKVASVSGSGTSGIGQLSFADAGGITVIDQWRVTTDANFSGGTNDITANWERNDTTGAALLGTGVSESSGVFTFGSTGLYLIQAGLYFVVNNANSMYTLLGIRTCQDGSSFSDRVQVATHVENETNQMSNATGSYIFDVTNTSTHKVKLVLENQAAVTLSGDSAKDRTYIRFTKLAAT